jgi:hypothetical protein
VKLAISGIYFTLTAKSKAQFGCKCIKVSTFKEHTGTRKAIYFTMITSFGLQKNNYSALLVQNELTMDALFA